jgi:hypothetical protein
MPDDILQWKGRRALVDTKKSVPAADFLEAGNALLEKGYLAEALDFFRKAEAWDAVRGMASQAVGEGDFFIYSLSRQALGLRPDRSELKALAGNARDLGLLAYEAKALGLLEADERPDEKADKKAGKGPDKGPPKPPSP